MDSIRSRKPLTTAALASPALSVALVLFFIFTLAAHAQTPQPPGALTVAPTTRTEAPTVRSFVAHDSENRPDLQCLPSRFFSVTQVAQGQNSNSSPKRQGYTPPTSRQRFRRYLNDTIGPVGLLRAGITSGVDQARDRFPEWGQGASGYGKRFASRFGQIAIQETTEYGLSEVLRVDGGFERSRKRGFLPRLGDALVQNVSARTRDGRRVFSVPRVASVYAGGINPAVTWYPERYGVKDGLRSGTTSLGIGFGINVLCEFVIRR